MNFKISKFLSATLLIVMIMLVTTSIEVYADLRIKSDTNSANLKNEGSTSTFDSGILFGSVTINMAGAIAPISRTDYIRADNKSSSDGGWHVNVSATNFTATVTDDSSAVVGATLTVNIPANTMLTVTPQAPTKSGNKTDLTGVTAQNTSGIAVTSSPGVKVLSASDTACVGGCGKDGAGYYLQLVNYTLALPNYLPGTATITDAQADSKFIAANRSPGAKIGLFAGTYSTTITYSIVTGP